ncbi:MAG: thermonuclease family protein [bacterium]
MRGFLLMASVALAMLTLFGSAATVGAVQCANPPIPDGLYPAMVSRVVDGDTIVVSVDRRRERTRLIGVDTPELHQSAKLNRDAWEFGRLSSNFTSRYLLGQDVALELDVQKRDRYRRLLAYVWLEDGTLFNMLIVREGYALVSTYPPNVKYVEVFLACQREARENLRGLWGR